MTNFNPSNYGRKTLAVRAGKVQSQEGENSELMYLTSSFVFENAAQAAARFSGDSPGNIYSRFSNPNVNEFVSKMCSLELMEDGFGTASGMAAVFASLAALLKSGDHDGLPVV